MWFKKVKYRSIQVREGKTFCGDKGSGVYLSPPSPCDDLNRRMSDVLVTKCPAKPVFPEL